MTKLKEKAAGRNKDEFYFGMINSKTVVCTHVTSLAHQPPAHLLPRSPVNRKVSMFKAEAMRLCHKISSKCSKLKMLVTSELNEPWKNQSACVTLLASSVHQLNLVFISAARSTT